MKKLALFLTLSLISSCGYFSIKATNPNQFFDNESGMQYVEGSQDIPLAEGLEKIGEDAMAFDSPGGNVLSISYKSKIDLEEVKDFYLKTLPQMGWKIVKTKRPTSIEALDFERKNESLEIEFVNENGRDLVKFYAELGV